MLYLRTNSVYWSKCVLFNASESLKAKLFQDEIDVAPKIILFVYMKQISGIWPDSAQVALTPPQCFPKLYAKFTIIEKFA